MILRTPRFVPAFVLALVLDTAKFGHDFDVPGKPLKKAKQDVKVKTIQIDNGVEYATFHGQFDAVNALVSAQKINPAMILAEGDNAATLKDTSRRDDLKLQVIAITRIPEGMTLAQAQASIGKSDIESRFKEDYTYGHMIAAMNKGIDIAAWGPNYTGPWAQYATAVRISRYVDMDTRTIEGSESNVLYLYGRNGERTTLAMITGQLGSIKVLTSDVKVDEQLRQAISPKFLLQAVLNSSAPYSINVDGILAFLGDETTEVNWTEHTVDGNITEMTAADDTDNFILSLSDSEFAHLPIGMVVIDDDNQLVPYAKFGVKVADIGEDIEIAAISRASFQIGLVVSVDQNGGDMAIRFTDIDLGLGDESAYGLNVAKMIEAAGTDQLAA
jgi:hypothetical protein